MFRFLVRPWLTSATALDGLGAASVLSAPRPKDIRSSSNAEAKVAKIDHMTEQVPNQASRKDSGQRSCEGETGKGLSIHHPCDPR